MKFFCDVTEKALLGALILPWPGQDERIDHCRAHFDNAWFQDLTHRAVYESILLVDAPFVHFVTVYRALQGRTDIATVSMDYLMGLERSDSYVPSCYRQYASALKELKQKTDLYHSLNASIKELDECTYSEVVDKMQYAQKTCEEKEH